MKYEAIMIQVLKVDSIQNTLCFHWEDALVVAEGIHQLLNAKKYPGNMITVVIIAMGIFMTVVQLQD